MRVQTGHNVAMTDPGRSYGAAQRALIQGFVGFWSAIVACLVVSHSATTEQDGISYFGVHATTLPLIVLGYASVIAGMLVAAQRLPADPVGRRLALPLRAMPVCAFLLLLTPFNHGTALNWSHMTVGVSLAFSEAAVTVWLLAVLAAPGVAAGALLELVGGVICALSLPGTSFNHLLQGELLFNLGFCVAIVAALQTASRAESSDDRFDEYDPRLSAE
jgi:hypothetical protein